MPSVLGTNVLAEVAGSITDFFEKLSGPEGTKWLVEFKRFLRKEICWPSEQLTELLAEREDLKRRITELTGGVAQKVVSIVSLVKIIATPAIAGKKTSDCFTNKSRYHYRDGDLDNWLPEVQPDQAQQRFSVQKLIENATFKQVVESFLGVTADITTLARLLKERGATTTLPTVESLIERQENGEDVGLRIDGWANFFFVEDEDDVSVVYANRHYSQWDVRVYSLGCDCVWHDEDRFFFRNQTL